MCTIRRNDVQTALRGLLKIRRSKKIFSTVLKFLSFELYRKELRYLIAGAWNTAFSYCLVVVLYEVAHRHAHIMIIGTIATIISVAQSFITHKLFVFRTKSNWLRELLRSYVVYGFVSFIGIILLWFLVDILSLSIYVAQAIIMILLAFISYLGHLKFTFKH